MAARLVLRGGMIRRLKEARGIPSDEVVARMIGVDRGTLRRVEQGAQPSGAFIANASVAFGMGIGELFEVIEFSSRSFEDAA